MFIRGPIIGGLSQYTKSEITYAVRLLSRYNETKTYASCKLAMDSPESEKWHEAKELENSALAYKEVMVLIDIKPGITLIKSKYVFKIKRKFGKIERYKARLVAMRSMLSSTLHQ